MRRREFISLFCGIAAIASGSARAQSSGSLHRIGFLGNSTAVLEANLIGPFRKALRDLGYAEGRDIAIEYRWAEGNYERFPALVAELIASGVEVIVTAGTPAAFAVKNATSSIPSCHGCRGRSRRHRTCREPCAARRKFDRVDLDLARAGRQAVGATARNGSDAVAFRGALEPSQRISCRCRTRRAGRGQGLSNEGSVVGRSDLR